SLKSSMRARRKIVAAEARGDMSETREGMFARRQSAAFRQTAPLPGGAARAGLAQRDRSGRIGIRLQGPAGQGCGQAVVMDPCPQIGRRDSERRSNINGRAAAEAVAAARKSMVMAMLMERRFSVVVGMPLEAGLVVSAVQMKRSMGVAADQSDRQQQDQAAQEQGSLHGTGTNSKVCEFFPNPA